MSKNILEHIKSAWKRFKHHSTPKKLLVIGKYILFTFLGLCILGLGLFFYFTYDLPQPEKFAENPFVQSTKIYDRTGKVLLYDIYGEEKREVVPFDKISDNLKHAIISSEDARFYQHGGIDLEAIFRSILVDLKFRSASQGASTITQQLIRSVYLTRQKTIARKIREIVLSIELERRYSKDQIFDWYLNEIPFGKNAYGAEAAAQTYFDKPASDLDLAQSAALTSLIPAPSHYSPYGPNKDELLKRKDYVLERMLQLGYINDKQFNDAKAEKLTFSEDTESIKAPHFVMYIQKYLEDKYGEDYLKEKGLKVYTTLDWDLQSYAEQVIKESDKTNVSLRGNNTALVVVDPKTGEILSLVGSKDYFGASYPNGCDEKAAGSCLFDPKFDVATMGNRQPGSAFKPFVYATAFKEGYTPDTKLWDVKTEFNTNCSPDGNQETDFQGLKCYHPQDYDGKYRGQVTLRSSLAESLNIPSVELLYLAGLKDSIKTAQDMGLTTLTDPNRYGLSLVLGGGEVNLLEMTSAYGIFATEGFKTDPVSILRIEDSQGNVIEENKKQPTKVLDTQVAREVTDILSDNDARAPIFGQNNALHFDNYQVAAKTGTTQFYSDAWTIGYTPFASVGVWVGNNDNSPTNKKTGIGLAAPIWRKVTEKLLTLHPVENFTKPDPVNTNPILLGQFPPQDPPHSILYYINKKDPQGGVPANPSADPMYSFWEAAVQNFIGVTNPNPNPDPNNPNPLPNPLPNPNDPNSDYSG
jgi:1A family penicillin-binding protein